VIDLHCHLHYGVDDGPKTESDALALARALVDAGVTTVATTSHVRPDKGWRNTAAKQAELHEKLDALLDGYALPLKRVRAAEHYLDDELMGADLEARAVPYGTSRTLLVELPYQGAPPDLLGLLFKLRQKGFFVLLAHLERYPYVVENEALLERIVNAGHLIQVNLGSLAGAYTRGHKKAAERLVDQGLVSVASSDCHSREDVKTHLENGRKVLTKRVGEAAVNRLLVDNPQKILDGLPPERIWP
jgi:protein-tyrosine phosphatase